MVDVQTEIPDIKLSLTKVGVNNVRKLLRVPRKGKRPIILLANFDLYIDLPSTQKGIHMSRNLEAINEIIEEVTEKPVYSLENLCSDIVQEVINRHNYANTSEVRMDSRLMTMRRTPGGRKVQDFVNLQARARVEKYGEEINLEKEVGARSRGIILSPDEGSGTGCTKRAEAELSVQFHKDEFVKIEDILEILDTSMSSRAYGFLNRDEEREVIKKACSLPKTVNQVIEDILTSCKENFRNLSDDACLKVKCTAEEPLFTYKTMAKKTITLSKLRAR